MPEPVFYFRGFPPFADPSEAVASNREMLADLAAVADLSDKQVDDLHRQLSTATGFLDPVATRSLVSALVGEDKAVRVIRTLRNVGPTNLERLLRSLDERSGKDDFPLAGAALERLRGRLRKLVGPFPALARFEKAERLAGLTGQQLESIELICDLRPIFNESREFVEGLMPYTRLRVVATGVDGLPRSFEAELSHQQVHDLAGKASKAKSKLGVLREAIEGWVPCGLPNVPLTRPPREDSTHA